LGRNLRIKITRSHLLERASALKAHSAAEHIAACALAYLRHLDECTGDLVSEEFKLMLDLLSNVCAYTAADAMYILRRAQGIISQSTLPSGEVKLPTDLLERWKVLAGWLIERMAQQYNDMKDREIIALPYEWFQRLLSRDTLNISLEDHVFERVKQYIQGNALSVGRINDLWRCIRFAYLSSDCLVSKYV
jgi:hypothetical protein